MSSTRSIAMGGLFAALHVILLLLVTIIPGIEFILVIGLPLISAYYAYYHRLSWNLIFALSTFLLTAMVDPFHAIIWIWPSIIIGIAYGSFVRLQLKSILLVLIMTFIHSATLWVLFHTMTLLLGYDVIDHIRDTIFHMDQELFFYLAPSFLLIYGLVQSFMTHLLLSQQLFRFQIKIDIETIHPRWFVLLSLGIYIISFIMGLVAPTWSFSLWLMVVATLMILPIIGYAYNDHLSNPIILLVQAFIVLFGSIPLLGLLATNLLWLFFVVTLPLIPMVIVYFIRHYTHSTFWGKIQ